MRKQHWFFYSIIQLMTLAVAAIVLTIGILINSPEPHEVQPIPYRTATEQEEQAWQEKQLADTLKAIQEKGNLERR